MQQTSQPTMALVGDVMIHRADALSMFRNVADVLKKADIAYCNLEGPICEDGPKHPGKAGIGMELRSTPNAIDALLAAGIDVVSLANNHALDFGISGLEQTIKTLQAANIGYAGAGPNLSDARRPIVMTKHGIKVAFLSYTSVCHPSFAATSSSPGVAMVRIDTTYSPNLRLLMQPGSPMHPKTKGVAEDVAAVLEDVRAAKAEADIVVVAWHWGISERWGKLADYQRELGHAAIDAGADAVVGHHAHMLLGIEFYRERPIFYSLGNFAFDLEHRYFSKESAIIECDISKQGIGPVRLVPVVLNARHEPELASSERAADRVVWKLEEMSEEFGTKFTPQGTYVVLSP